MNKSQQVLQLIDEIRLSPGQAAAGAAGAGAGAYAGYKGLKYAGKRLKQAIEQSPTGDIKRAITDKAKRQLHMG